MKFTESVRSFHVPATPCTSAWPPSLPSVPTSRATRVTSEANDESWSTIVLMVFFSSRISPFTSTVIFCDRSPFATAVVTSAMLRTWAVRFQAMEFTESVRSFHVPAHALHVAPGRRACPSVPTSRATRVTSAAKDAQLVHHRVDGVLQLEDLALHVHRDLRRQVAVAPRPSSPPRCCAPGAVRFAGHGVHGVGQVLPRAGHALHVGLAAQLVLRCPPRAPRASLPRRTTRAGPPSC